MRRSFTLRAALSALLLAALCHREAAAECDEESAAAGSCAADGSDLPQVRTLSPGAKFKFERRWIRDFEGAVLALDPSGGYAYLLETQRQRVQAFTSEDGKYILSWGKEGSGEGETLVDPRDLAVGDDGSVYIVDKCQIKKFEPGTGDVLKTWGSCGSGEGQFVDPTGIASDRFEPWLYVLDAGAQRVLKLDPQGQLLASWSAAELAGGVGITVGADGGVYVVDASSSSVHKYDPKGNRVNSFGGKGSGQGQFETIAAITADTENNIFVLDSALGRVQVFTEEGAYLTSLGAQGSGDGQLARPTWIETNNLGDSVYVVDDGKFIKQFTLEREEA